MIYNPYFFGFTPFYRPYYGYGFGFGSSINTFGSQIGTQSLVNTGTMAGVNQTFSPTQIW